MSGLPQKLDTDKKPPSPVLSVVKDGDKNQGAGAGDTQQAPADTTVITNNIIKRSVSELTTLYGKKDEVRNDLRARGIQDSASNVMVDMLFHDRGPEMAGLLEAALESSRKALGHGAIEREALEEALDNMLAIEKDLVYNRRLCKQRGLDIRVLNMLSQLIRQNPGDGGQKAINAFLAYSQACDIKLSGIAEITQKYTREPTSVLPEIERQSVDEVTMFRRQMFRDICIGVLLSVSLLMLIA